MEEALKKVSDDLGISFEIGKIRYSSDMFRTQIVCVVANTSDDSSVAKVQWNQYCSRYSLSPDDFGKTFKSLSKTQANTDFEIVGCKPKSHKYPILAKNLSDGKTYKFPVSRVRRRIITFVKLMVGIVVIGALCAVLYWCCWCKSIKVC